MYMTLKERTLDLAAVSVGNFYDLAKSLRQLYEEDPSAIREFWEAGNLARRTVYHFLDVGLLIRNQEISKDVAEKIGWTKLQTVARHVTKVGVKTPEQLDEFLKIAKKTKARDLKEALDGKKPKETRAEALA